MADSSTPRLRKAVILGATGYVGDALCRAFRNIGVQVIAPLRSEDINGPRHHALSREDIDVEPFDGLPANINLRKLLGLPAAPALSPLSSHPSSSSLAGGSGGGGGAAAAASGIPAPGSSFPFPTSASTPNAAAVDTIAAEKRAATLPSECVVVDAIGSEAVSRLFFERAVAPLLAHPAPTAAPGLPIDGVDLGGGGGGGGGGAAEATSPAVVLGRSLGDLSSATPTENQGITFIGISSVLVYGAQPGVRVAEDLKASSDTGMEWRAALDEQVAAAGGIILRPGWAFGRSGGRYSWLQYASTADGNVVIRGTPGNHHSWVHVDDLGAAAASVFEHRDRCRGHIFNVADDSRHPTRQEMVIAITIAAGIPDDAPPIRYEPVLPALTAADTAGLTGPGSVTAAASIPSVADSTLGSTHRTASAGAGESSHSSPSSDGSRTRSASFSRPMSLLLSKDTRHLLAADVEIMLSSDALREATNWAPTRPHLLIQTKTYYNAYVAAVREGTA